MKIAAPQKQSGQIMVISEKDNLNLSFTKQKINEYSTMNKYHRDIRDILNQESLLIWILSIFRSNF
jgi:hypothetical protein